MIEKPFIFKINDNGSGPNLLLQVCLERGWQEHSEETCSRRDQWNIWWRSGGFSVAHYRHLKGWQFTNHVPKASFICRKDNLSRYLRTMKHNYGNIYDFSPEAFVLPLDYTKLVEQCSKLSYEKNEKSKRNIWICKPVGQSQGRGISLFRNISELTYDTNSVVQRYVNNPLLIGGYKFDLRLYVCVPCFHPLTIYLYREGLARFSTDKFSLKDITNRYAHLTNCAINKQGPGYFEMKEKVGAGCKWSLKQLRHYLNQNGIDDWLLWQRITSLVVLTITSQLNGIPNAANCFEFYGFDVLIDQGLKPWLIEVNLSPALGTDCEVDPAVKKPLLHDLFDLLGLPVCNTGLSLFDSWSSRRPPPEVPQDEGPPVLLRSSASLVTMACKWKKQINSTSSPTSQSFKRARIRGRTPKNEAKQIRVSTPRSAKSRIVNKPIFSPNFEDIGGNHDSEYDDFLTCEKVKNKSRLKSLCKWDNGVDWSDPPNEEGDWVRVYPLLKKNRNFGVYSPTKEKRNLAVGDREVRQIVSDMSKFNKMTREVYTTFESQLDEKKDASIICTYRAADAVWHPLLTNACN